MNGSKGKFVVRSLLTAGVGLAWLFSGAAQAQLVVGSDQFQVTANVLGQCQVTATDLNFGSYDQGSAVNVDGTSSVDVICPATIQFEVGLDGGQSGAIASRAMVGGLPAGGPDLNYQLFQDAARTVVWGETFQVDTQTITGNAPNPVNLSVFGRIPSGQSPNPGAFADTVTAVVLF